MAELPITAHHIDRENDVPLLNQPVVPPAKHPHVDRRIGYLPIRSYGIIGDCKSAALVGVDGSVDWLCLPRFQDSSLFAAILDGKHGGAWTIQPEEPHHSTSRYLPDTNVLETVFTTPSGVMRVVDFMPASAYDLAKAPGPSHRPRLVRIVEGLAGRVKYTSKVNPAFGYGSISKSCSSSGKTMLHADVDEAHYCFRVAGKRGEKFEAGSLSYGTMHAYSLIVGRAPMCPLDEWTVSRAQQLREETIAFWRDWVAQCDYQGPYVAEVRRSALALKLLSYAPSGAFVAAPTTSLPEKIHGKRNWDYRFTWLRDAAFSVTSLVNVGFLTEAERFFRWVDALNLGDDVPNLFSVEGDLEGTEENVLKQFEGYRRSRPVRIGNAAAHQKQWDVYGEVVDAIYHFAMRSGELRPRTWKQVETLVNLAQERWHLPDASIWEIRGPDRRFCYSQMMCWVALDRGIRLAAAFHLQAPIEEWTATREAIARSLVTEYYHEDIGSFSQAVGHHAVDASILRIATLGVLPGSDPRIIRTIERVQQELGHGPFLHRYLREGDVDGMPRGEGAFLICSFWMVEALAHAGEYSRARQLFEQLLSVGSPLGLFSEEVDITTGDMLGNFPQAFSHLGIINAALALEEVKKRPLYSAEMRRTAREEDMPVIPEEQLTR